jgi:general secretion pathway protein N
MTRAGEKALTLTLAGACAALFALALAMQLGVGRGYHWDEDGAGAGEPVAGAAIDDRQFALPPQTEFAVIGERPVFNEDRKPAPEEPNDAPGAPPPSPLNISLTGTVLVGTPPVHIAMVRENGKATTISLKEGMPLPGDQAAWTLSQVKNRSAIFKSSAGEEVEVELAVASAGQKPNPAPVRPGAVAPGHAAAPPPGSPVTAQSDELQHRIEERRKQMREAAERMKAQRPPEQNQPQQQQQ